MEMEIVVVAKEEQTIPANWKTAREMREAAENWTNTELKSCIDSLMGKIKTMLPIVGKVYGGKN